MTEDFTTYTEVDPNNHISKTAQHVDFQDYRNEDAYLYKDKGAGYFTNFVHLIDVKSVSAGASRIGFIWMLSNDVDDAKGLKDALKTFISVERDGTVGNSQIYLYEYYNGTGYPASGYAISEGTWYYLKIEKSGTTLTLKIYSDAARTNLLNTQTLTLHGDWTFRYVFACNTWNSGNNLFGDIDIENLDLAGIAYYISGVTRDANGNPLGSCTVWLFRTSDKSFSQETTSDVNGNYSFTVYNNITQFFIRAHKDGSPNVFGTTDKNLTGA